MPDFTADDHKVLSAMREAVLDKGYDYVYSPDGEPDNRMGWWTCYYLAYDANGRQTGEASCLIGHGLLDSGVVPLSVLRGSEGTSASMIIPGHGNADYFVQGLNRMQEDQDSGYTWGDAFENGLDFLAANGYDVSAYRLTA